jgi:hypothetical protein
MPKSYRKQNDEMNKENQVAIFSTNTYSINKRSRSSSSIKIVSIEKMMLLDSAFFQCAYCLIDAPLPSLGSLRTFDRKYKTPLVAIG